MNKEKREEWRDVVGYEGLYQVSNEGRVRNRHGHILTQCYKNGSIYKRVHLARNNSAKWHSVHRVVALAFLPRIEGKDTVNHLDHNKENNCVENLEWVSLKENCAYAAQEGRYKVPYDNLLKGRGLLKKAVIATAKDGTEYEFESITQGARILGASRRDISQCCNKKYGHKTSNGYHWRFA